MATIRDNRESVLQGLTQELLKLPEDKRDVIKNMFMKHYDEQMALNVLNMPKRSFNSMRTDVFYWRAYPTGPTESEMGPFMDFALLYFLDNWITNWMYSFYDRTTGDLLDHFGGIVN